MTTMELKSLKMDLVEELLSLNDKEMLNRVKNYLKRLKKMEAEKEEEDKTKADTEEGGEGETEYVYKVVPNGKTLKLPAARVVEGNPLLLKRLLAGLITLFSILNCAFVVSSVSSSLGG